MKKKKSLRNQEDKDLRYRSGPVFPLSAEERVAVGTDRSEKHGGK